MRKLKRKPKQGRLLEVAQAPHQKAANKLLDLHEERKALKKEIEKATVDFAVKMEKAGLTVIRVDKKELTVSEENKIKVNIRPYRKPPGQDQEGEG